jgi:NhaA family Na+:H+ antiporter
MICVGFLAGIGFTMALFVGHLDLKVPDVEMYSKLGILLGSLFAAATGMILLSMGRDLSSEENIKS